MGQSGEVRGRGEVGCVVFRLGMMLETISPVIKQWQL